MKKLYWIVCDDKDHTLFEGRYQGRTRGEALKFLKLTIGRKNLNGLVFTITEIPVPLIREIVAEILAGGDGERHNGFKGLTAALRICLCMRHPRAGKAKIPAFRVIVATLWRHRFFLLVRHLHNLFIMKVARAGIEPATRGFSIRCSTN
jgi:hypothetical protein